MTYSVKNSRDTILATIEDNAVDRSSTSLVLHGRSSSPYGTKRNENLVRLLENFSNTVSPSSPIDGQLWWDRSDLRVWDSTIGSPLGSWELIIPESTGLGFSVNAGAGLTGGGFPTGSPLAVVINVIAGSGITVTGSPSLVSIDLTTLDHDLLAGYESNEHIDHSTVTITAGAGLTGTANITNDVTINVGAGDGIQVNSNDVQVDLTVVQTNNTQTINGIKIFTDQIRGDVSGTSASVPAFGFGGFTSTGIYRSNTNELSFTTSSTQRFRIESGGVLRSLNNSYESLVTTDDVIPNKKYVDDLVGGATFPTSNTFVGVSNVSGLSGTATYLVNVYGICPDKGGGNATLSSVTLRRGSTTPGVGTIVDATPSQWIDWPDGNMPTEAAFIAAMSGNTSLNCVINDSATGFGQVNSLLMTAVHLSG